MKYAVVLLVLTISACMTDFSSTPYDIEVEDEVGDTVEDTVLEDTQEDVLEDPVEEEVPECLPYYEGGDCNLFTQCGCPDDMKCDFQCRAGPSGWAMYESCVPAGALGLGAACTATADCAAGFTCAVEQCVQYCQETSDCPGDLRCYQHLVVSECDGWESDPIVCW